MLSPRISSFHIGYKPLLKATNVLAALQYYSLHYHFSVIADTIRIDETSFRRSVLKVTSALNQIFSRYITFTKLQGEIHRAMQSFYSIGGFPNVIGAIDGT